MRSHPLFAPLCLQLTHLALSSAWNLLGVWRIAHGGSAPGPTASLAAVAVMGLCAALLIAGARRAPWLYALTTVVIATLTLPAIIGAFTREPGLWPNDVWRLGGAALNSVGVAAACWGLAVSWRQRSQSQCPEIK